jgi:hypothetical protein
MKILIKLLIIFFLLSSVSYAQIIVTTIDSVRVQDANGVSVLLGDTVTVKGVVTTHKELGIPTVYFQVPTAGLVAYSSNIGNVVTRGDSVQVTGVVTNYNGLTELNPVTTFTVLAPGITTPVPHTITPTQARENGESYESRLIRIAGVTAVKTSGGAPATQWTVSGSGTNYWIFVGSDSCQIRIYATSNIANTNIRPFPFSVVALESQYKSSSPYFGGYQIIPRDTNDFSPLTNINIISNNTPENYKLHQNYPNPFNPSSTIKYDVAKSGHIMLKVYDALGREISELVNSNQVQGTYEVTFNAQSLTSGIYFYSLFANGSKIDTKSMVLIK